LDKAHSLQVSECLARRKQVLTLPRAELLEWAVHAAAQTEPSLHAWVTFAPQACSAAPEPSIFQGIPFGVKDVIDVAGMVTGAGSRSRADAVPCQRDADAVATLRAHGACVAGKTVTTEFAYLDPGPTTNPFDWRHTPGGSSSGSAAAVGAGVVPLAFGTQTAGSVCRPAAYCGAYAFKPTTGSTAPAGVVPFAPSFDTIGIFGLDLELVSNAAMLLTGKSPRDFGSEAMECGSPRIGYLDDAYFTDISPACQDQVTRALQLLSQAGFPVRPVRLGLEFEELRSVHRTIMQHEAFLHHGALLASQPDRIGPNWKGALEAGSAITAQHAMTMHARLALARATIADAMRDIDILLLPPIRTEAPEGIASTGDAGLIVPWTYAAAPLVVMPTGLSASGLPLAVMIAGKAGQDEATALAAACISAVLKKGGLSIDF
jgi:Asp-tRNA(Asn)/Glu-tRNA(Gln) amidotransferase A subunit family amidase